MGEKHKKQMSARALGQSKSPFPALGGNEKAGSKRGHGEGVHNVRLVFQASNTGKAELKEQGTGGKWFIYRNLLQKMGKPKGTAFPA